MLKIGVWTVLSIVGVVSLIGGCSSKDRELYDRLHQRSPELRTLQQSDKVIFRPGDANETIVVATYLPERSKESEVFLLAVHPADQLSGEKSFTLNGKAPQSFQRVSRDEIPQALRRTVPRWFTLYRVEFPKNAGKKLTMDLTDKRGEKRSLLFYKGPKYLITKPKF